MGKSVAPKKQMGVALDEHLRANLEASAKARGTSIAEEIRRRLEDSVWLDTEPATRRFCEFAYNLSFLLRLQTRQEWHSHAASNRIFKQAIDARLDRLLPAGELEMRADEFSVVSPVAAGSAEAVGKALEAIDFHNPPSEQQRVLKKVLKYGDET